MVVYAHVPYEDGTGEKTRPAVIKERHGREVTLLPCTTSSRRFQYPARYHEVEDLASAGLDRATGVRLTPVVVDAMDLIKIAGALSESDAARILGLPGEAA